MEPLSPLFLTFNYQLLKNIDVFKWSLAGHLIFNVIKENKKMQKTLGM